MHQSEKSKIIESACREIMEKAPKPKPKKGNWNVHVLVANNRAEINKLIDKAAEKYGIGKDILKRIILR